MSRDDFDFINLTENLEKNTEELIKEVETEAKMGKNQPPSFPTNLFETETTQRRDREVRQEPLMYQQESRREQTSRIMDAEEQYRYGQEARRKQTARTMDVEEQSRYGQEARIQQTSRVMDTEQQDRYDQENRRPQTTRAGDIDAGKLYGYGQENRREQRTQDVDIQGQDRYNQERRNQQRARTIDAEEETRYRQEKKKRNKKNREYQEEGEGAMSRKGKGKKIPSKRKNKLKGKLIKIAIILIILFGAIYGLAYSVVSKTNYEKRESEYVRPDDVETVRGVKNILLIGTDARSTEEDGRSDSMIIVSINDKQNRIVMTSVLRDSYVEIPGHGHNRINAAYSYGQEDLLIQTIEHNYKIPIDAYAKVDFFSFIDIVDSVGGVEIEITDEEMQWINAYLNETNELLGKEFGDGYLTQSGLVNLTGKQALSFARIRYIGTDFGRTERQRKILTAVLDKIKKNPTSVSSLMSTVLPNVTTDMKASELTMMTMQAVMYLGYDMEQFTLPTDNTWKNASISGMSVLEIDFEANIKAFKEVVYGDKTVVTEETGEISETEE